MKGKIFLIILFIAFWVIGVPIAINESYKHSTVYITMWDASDVLTYYGTILGATATIAALLGTIVFTQKQIQRNQFLERSHMKWKKVESIITQTLIDISPLRMYGNWELDTNNSPIANIHAFISTLQSYAATAKTSLDMIKCYINPTEHEEIADYVKELNSAIKQFCQIESELENQYMILQNLGIMNNGQIPDAAFFFCISQTNEINKKIPVAHEGIYQNLLNMKREVFEKIYANIDAQANQILKFGEKRVNCNANT